MADPAEPPELSAKPLPGALRVFAALFDHRSAIYLLLAVAAVGLGAVWIRTRDRRLAIGFAVAIGLLLLFGLIDLLRGETDTEQIVRKTRAMAAAVQAKDVDAIFRHVSDRFALGTVDKATFRAAAAETIRANEVQSLTVNNFGPVRFTPAGADSSATARIEFVAFIAGVSGDFEGKRPLRVTARFVRDADGQWRLLGFDVFDGVNGEPLTVPHLGGG
jgi:ketosteroid isomerase-like protein